MQHSQPTAQAGAGTPAWMWGVGPCSWLGPSMQLSTASTATSCPPPEPPSQECGPGPDARAHTTAIPRGPGGPGGRAHACVHRGRHRHVETQDTHTHTCGDAPHPDTQNEHRRWPTGSCPQAGQPPWKAGPPEAAEVKSSTLVCPRAREPALRPHRAHDSNSCHRPPTARWTLHPSALTCALKGHRGPPTPLSSSATRPSPPHIHTLPQRADQEARLGGSGTLKVASAPQVPAACSGCEEGGPALALRGPAGWPRLVTPTEASAVRWNP